MDASTGRGRRGGQVRDEYRQDYDSGRGGWGGRHGEYPANEMHGSQKKPRYTSNPRFRSEDVAVDGE